MRRLIIALSLVLVAAACSGGGPGTVHRGRILTLSVVLNMGADHVEPEIAAIIM